MNLIETLNANIDKTPDQIAAIVGDPLAFPISFQDLGLEQFKKFSEENRRVHFLNLSYNNQVTEDSGDEGEILRPESSYYTWCSDPIGRNWYLISHEAFQSFDLSTWEVQYVEG